MPETKASILIVDDEQKLCSILSKEFSLKGYQVHVANDRGQALSVMAGVPVDVVLLDIVLPGADGVEILRDLRRDHACAQVVMLTGNASIETAVQSMKHGAYDYITKPYCVEELCLIVDRAHAEARTRRANEALRLELSRHVPAGELIGGSAKLGQVRELLAKLAAASAPVLIVGEPGTGKELAARTMHRQGLRADGPFLAVDCGGVEEAVLERELFGHNGGKGILELADEGIVFMDDVGRLPAGTQAKLLRFLESGEFSLSGATMPRRSRARIVGASREGLAEEAKAGRFNAELLSRLNVGRLDMPPLRERKEDIPVLAEHFFAQWRGRQSRGPGRLAPETLDRLSRYGWPGNVRQLESVIQRAVILGDRDSIEPDDVCLPLGADGPCEASASLAAVERAHILKVLGEAGGNRTRAAAVLDIDVKTLYNKLKEYRL